MATKVNSIPDGYHSVTPYMILSDAAKAIEFYKVALGAVEVMRVADPEGKIRHAEIRIGDSPIMLTNEHEGFPDYLSPLARGGSPVHIYLYVENVDTLFNQAIAAGAQEIMPIADHFYGDRSGTLKDPFGHTWYIATHREDVSPEELLKRAADAGKA